MVSGILLFTFPGFHQDEIKPGTAFTFGFSDAMGNEYSERIVTMHHAETNPPYVPGLTVLIMPTPTP